MTGTEFIPFELAKDWLTRLLGILREKRAERREELQQIANVFGDPIELASFYVEPDCQQFNPADYADEDSYHVVREPVFDRVAQFLSGSADRRGRHLLVLSDAGTGKTSLLVMLKLSHMTSMWTKAYKCELLKLGKETLDQIARIEDKSSTVLLLDGLDEDPEAWNSQETRIRDILGATATFFRTIITCRTQFLDINQDPFLRRGRIELSGHLCPVVYTSLFSDRQVKKYLQRRFGDKLQSSAWEERAFGIVQKMGMLSMRPMLLAHIDDLVESEQDEWTLYGVYTALVRAWLIREQRKIYETQREVVDIKKLLDGCRHAAFVMQSQDRPWITRDELEMHAKLYSGIAGISLMQLGVRSLLARDTDRNYRFSHFSILEYLVVDSMVSEFATPLVNAIKPTSLMRSFAASWIRSNSRDAHGVSRLSKVGLQGADLANAQLDGINLFGFDCTGTDFANSSLTAATFADSVFDGASFASARLNGALFRSSSLAKAQFQNAEANSASFQSCQLQSATFQSAILENAVFNDSNLSSTEFIDANLRAAKMSAGVFSRTDFSSADASRAEFSSVTLEECHFSHTNLCGSTFLNSIASSASAFADAVSDVSTVFPLFDRDLGKLRRDDA